MAVITVKFQQNNRFDAEQLAQVADRVITDRLSIQNVTDICEFGMSGSNPTFFIRIDALKNEFSRRESKDILSACISALAEHVSAQHTFRCVIYRVHGTEEGGKGKRK
jgi:hypothetical protein